MDCMVKRQTVSLRPRLHVTGTMTLTCDLLNTILVCLLQKACFNNVLLNAELQKSTD